MRILLDECIPRKLKDSLTDQECRTVPEEGLAGKKNGELLAMAEVRGFEMLLTMDRGLQYEQNLGGRRIVVVILRARSNRLADLLPHVPALIAALGSLGPGQFVRIGE